MNSNHDVDVVVVGSGAAGLTAAIRARSRGAEVLVLEKSDLVGGTSAFSGGMAWVPVNAHAHEVGTTDTREEALEYLHGLTSGRETDPDLVDAFVDRAHEAIEFLERVTPLRLRASRTFGDYYFGRPGSKARGRSLEPEPYPARAELGPWFDRVRSSPHMPHLRLDEIAGADAAADAKNANAVAAGAAALASHLPALMDERERTGVRCVGAALVGAMLRGALDLGVEVETGTRVRELVLTDGRVDGVVVDHGGSVSEVRARAGVVLASGGFEWNAELVRSFIGVSDLKPISPPTNEGDGLIMGLEAGAAVANMGSTWALPVIDDFPNLFEGRQMAIQDTPRMEAGVILVNRQGRRFTNEAICYMDISRAYRLYDPLTQSWPNESPVWSVFDQRVRDRIAIRDLQPGSATPAWVTEAATLRELADLIDVPADTFVAEVERFNGHVAAGADPDFGRGTVFFEAWTSGGPTPERALATVAQPPFYAIRIFEGTIGTNGGLLTDADGRVKAMRGGVIDGLYAAGNAAASACGPVYPAGGITLGEAITFGYLAGDHAASQAQERPRPAAVSGSA
jgi:3-oxosteroid 1-dehydrogenase